MTQDDPEPDPAAELREVLYEAGSHDPPAEADQHAEAVCDFCRMPVRGDPVTTTVAGRQYAFCTAACRDELERTDAVFTEYHGFRRIAPGVAGLNRDLPQGIPRNSFVLLSGEAGTREDALGAEVIWRTLERGEPATMVTFTEPPISLVQRFLDLQWNVLPALEQDRLRVVDCFTSRIDDPDRFHRRLNRWNQHLSRIADPQTNTVNDPGDPAEVRNKLDNAIDELSMIDRGAVHIDSLTEFGTLVQPVQAYDFIKDLRADVCKGRFVPIFGGATLTGEGDDFPHDLSYVVDGIVELRLSSAVVEDTLIRRMRVRKMNGVLAISEWKAYEFTGGRGLVPFDPIAEIAKHREAGGQPPPEERRPDGADGHSY